MEKSYKTTTVASIDLSKLTKASDVFTLVAATKKDGTTLVTGTLKDGTEVQLYTFMLPTQRAFGGASVPMPMIECNFNGTKYQHQVSKFPQIWLEAGMDGVQFQVLPEDCIISLDLVETTDAEDEPVTYHNTVFAPTHADAFFAYEGNTVEEEVPNNVASLEVK